MISGEFVFEEACYKRLYIFQYKRTVMHIITSESSKLEKSNFLCTRKSQEIYRTQKQREKRGNCLNHNKI
jgi:hypothetical protein